MPSLKQKASRGATHQILIPQSQAVINKLFLFIHAKKILSTHVDRDWQVNVLFVCIHEKKKKQNMGLWASWILQNKSYNISPHFDLFSKDTVSIFVPIISVVCRGPNSILSTLCSSFWLVSFYIFFDHFTRDLAIYYDHVVINLKLRQNYFYY